MENVKADWFNESWMNGTYHLQNAEVEINTSQSWMAVVLKDDEERNFYFQGDEADTEIKEVFDLWLKYEVTQQGAVELYLNKYF